MTKEGHGTNWLHKYQILLQLFAAIGRYDQLAEAIKLRFGGCTDMIYSNLSGNCASRPFAGYTKSRGAF